MLKKCLSLCGLYQDMLNILNYFIYMYVYMYVHISILKLPRDLTKTNYSSPTAPILCFYCHS